MTPRDLAGAPHQAHDLQVERTLAATLAAPTLLDPDRTPRPMAETRTETALHPEPPEATSYLEGGPGQSGLPFARFLFAGLERDFVVVDWDQRGTGKSHEALEPISTYTLDSIVGDTVELASYLRARLGERKIQERRPA